MSSTTPTARTALVLSGGGARGAYAVGVVRGLHTVLGSLRSAFELFTGTSVGAISSAHFAAHAERDDLGVADLARAWGEIRLRTHLRPRLRAWIGLSRRLRRATEVTPSANEWSLLDPTAFEGFVCETIPWTRIHENVQRGLVQGILISGLRISDGRTTTFAELSPGQTYVCSHDPRRDAVIGAIRPDHVLASAALPLVFPAREIDGDFYCDGGLRFNTPMAPAIRAGAERLVVVTLRPGRPSTSNGRKHYPKPFFLLGKILDALLLDPVDYDLHVLDRFNRVVEVLDRTMSAGALEQVHSVIANERGLPYRAIETLVFRPSVDLGMLAGDYIKSNPPARGEGILARTFLRRAAALGNHVEAEFASYLLFDGGFARRLVELGTRDVIARADEVRAFFRRRESSSAAASSA